MFVGAKSTSETLNEYITNTEKVVKLMQLLTDAKYLKFMFEHCQKEFVDMENKKMQGIQRVINSRINFLNRFIRPPMAESMNSDK